MQAEERKSPFLVKKVTENLPAIEVNVKAKAIKTRKIRLLEWAILAPLCELSDPKPTLEEIKNEFGIEKIEFLRHVAKELVTLDVLSLREEDIFETTDLGTKLYKSGKMISDPRNISFPMIYEPYSKEWFPGAMYGSVSEGLSDQLEEIKTPDFVPGQLVKEHTSKVKNILEKEESIIEHTIAGSRIINPYIELNILLKNEGIDIAITKEPFGDIHRSALKRTFKEKLLENGGLQKHLDEYYQKSAIFENLPVTQYHKLLEKDKLYSPLDESKIVDEILSAQNKWIIVANPNLFEYVSKSKNKPEVVVYISEQEEVSTNKVSNGQIIPSSIEICVLDKEHNFARDSIVSDKRTARLNIIETGNCNIPLYVLKENEADYSTVLRKILKERSSDNLKTKIAVFYLEPVENNFNEVVEHYPVEGLNNKKSALSALEEINILKSKIGTAFLSKNSESAVYRKIIGYLEWKDLIGSDSWFIYHSRTIFLERLQEIVTETIENSSKDTLETIKKCSLMYVDLGKIEGLFKNASFKSNYQEISLEISKSRNNLDQHTENLVQKIPISINKSELEAILKVLDVYKNNAKQVYLKKIKAYIDSDNQLANIEEALEICLLLKQNGMLPKAELVTSLASKNLEAMNWDLLKPDMGKQIVQLNAQFSKFSSLYDVRPLIKEYLPVTFEKPSDKNQVQYIFNNLSSLSKSDIADSDYIKAVIQSGSLILEKANTFENLKIYLFFLATAKRSFSKESLLSTSSDQIWKNVEPYLVDETAKIKEVKKDLDYLGLSERMKTTSKVDLNDKTTPGIHDKPSISRIVVDGSNVAWHGKKDGKASAKLLLKAYNDLRDKYKFESILIIVGAKLKYDAPDYDLLSIEIENGNILESPANSDNDVFIIKSAIEKDMLILTNDQYKEYKTKSPEWDSEIEKRRVTFMVDPKTSDFMLNFERKRG